MTATKRLYPSAPVGRPATTPAVGDIETAIRRRTEFRERALVPFLTAGYPSERRFVEALREAAAVGCDVIEVGVPFSDPIADGPVIQQASQHCLDRGITLRRALDAIHRASIPVPIVLMSYLNPLLAYGSSRLVRDAESVGVRGLILPDLPMSSHPPPEGRLPANASDLPAASGPQSLADQLSDGNLELILLAAPTTDAPRLAQIGRRTRGFLYAVTVTGVTGPRRRLPEDTAAFLLRARAATARPVLAGFGIANAESAGKVATCCDGVIIGSALIAILGQGPARTAVRQLGRFLMQIRRVLDTPKGARPC